MYNIKSGTRMVQTLKNKKDKVFTLYNNSINKSIEINYMGARLLRLIKNKSLKIENLLGLSFIQELIQLNFITNEENSNVMLSKKCHYKYPLTSISLELTNQCNLNCVHCYGSYGANVKGCFLPFDWIKNNLS